MGHTKILLYDIETSPLISYTWGTYEQNVIRVIEEWYILCFAYKWLGEKQTHVISLPDFPSYSKHPKDDKHVVKALHKLFSEADVIIAHNGDKFDQKKSNARFIFHGLKPPEPYRTIDTLKVARKYAAFTSNRLDALGDFMHLGRKAETGGFDLWLDCMAGKKEAWRKMKKYNKQDVVLLEQVYYTLRPWIDNHPAATDKPDACPKCGHTVLMSRGWRVTKTTRYRRFSCNNCGGYSNFRVGEKSKVILVN